MARIVRDTTLDSRTARARLKVRKKPYYRALDPGLHLGYRRSLNGGSWLVRTYLGQQDYCMDRIGTADDKADADGVAILNFTQAQEAARLRGVAITRQSAGLHDAGPYTVSLALKDYLLWLEQHRKTARDARWAADAFIIPKLGRFECNRLTAPQLRKWLGEVAEAPPRLRVAAGAKTKHRDMDESDEGRRRRRSTANRILATLKAALNRAWREGHATTDEAWRRVKPFPGTDASRVRYLTPAECVRLINAAPAGFRELVQAALLTGCRFSELAALVVNDFNADSGTLSVRISKTGKPRHVVLTEEGSAFFARLVTGRPGTDLILRRADDENTAWGKSFQARPMRAACRAAKIVPAINFHGLRHTWASLTTMNGAPLLVVAKNLGHTDTRMVEKHYGHMAPSFIADAIRLAAPRFGITPDAKVVSLARQNAA